MKRIIVFIALLCGLGFGQVEPVAASKYDWVMVFLKVGDKETAPGKEHLGIKDGMPVCYLDPNDPEQLKSIDRLSDNMKVVFAAMTWPISRLPELKDVLRPNQPDSAINKLTYRTRKKLFKLSDLAAAAGNPALEAAWRSKQKVEPIDGTKLSAALFKTSDVLNAPAVDLNLITSGSWTYGTAGTYATRALAYADLGNLTGDLTFTMISNITETANATLSINIGVYAFRDTNGKPNDGNFVTGWVTSMNYDGQLFSFQQSGTGSVEIDCHNIKTIRAHGVSVEFMSITSITSGAHTISIHDNVLDGASSVYMIGIKIDDAAPVVSIYNNIIYQCATGLYCKTMNASNLIENNSVECLSFGFRGNNQTFTMQNNYSSSGITDYRLVGSATGNNNASSDATAADGNWSSGSGNVINITPADEFVSLDDTNADFLKVVIGNLHIAGIAPSIAANTTGIRGNARPGGDGVTSIGADEYEIPATGNPGTYKRHIYKNRLPFKQGIYKQPIWGGKDDDF